MLKITNSFKKILQNKSYDTNIEFTWKNTYNSRKIFPANFNECRKIALMLGYLYLEFNELIYDLYSKDIRKVIGKKFDINNTL